MKKNLRNRLATLLAASALIGGTTLTLGASDAAAASDWTFSKGGVDSEGGFTIAAYYHGNYAGVMVWNADPVGSIPGDAFQVGDVGSDGWGMEASMIVPTSSRTATTRGHAAVYYSQWNTGNLDEGTAVYIQLCAVKDAYSSCSLAYGGHA
ncbi:hypothetical protein AB0J38_26660 [Streptomyces sp. NPDC050095]|uniref:hypothetical protein n=1 Tax=unclassified Streptomyces TaxID=2593676 RepID=UPI0034398FAF